VIEVGGVSVDVLDPTDYEEILGKLNRREFVEFVVTERDYEEEDWSFAPLPEITEDNDNEEN